MINAYLLSLSHNVSYAHTAAVALNNHVPTDGAATDDGSLYDDIMSV